MDNEQFDSLARKLATTHSRRSLLVGAVAGGIALLSRGDVTARRRGHTIAPPPPDPCPGQVVCGTDCCDSGQCNTEQGRCCSAGTTPCASGCCEPCARVTCGLDCCETDAQCCDGECCPPGHECLSYYFPEGSTLEEETCCRGDLICDTETTKCCEIGEQCCTRNGVSYCIPDSACCLPDECSPSDPQCLDADCPIGIWTCIDIPKPDGIPCEDGDLCTIGDTCQGGICTPGATRDCSTAVDEKGCFVGTGCNPVSGDCILSYIGDTSPCNNGSGICCTDTCIDGANCCSDTDCTSGLSCGSGQCGCADGSTPDLTTDPLNCGSCGNRCQLNATCVGGVCKCANSGTPGECASSPEFQCEPAGYTSGGQLIACSCASITGSVFGDPVTGGTVAVCPPGSSPCIGSNCKTCCPSGTLCSSGVCLQT